ncbi:inositol 1,4,5-trisphosphate receptor-interacting protein [Carcharodon carcharias]|uniref:inositol 1,4,5-trisphosphate receptor-interacting protein n=1 Tax=Carcharodon carcharias TaxID=13397 RepID=UPI001B7F0844|nr:inositol 1,4,5-trisphosphate receptor-interacting protein [Carcharodon carcharias]XP_041066219.1 inositol 1,4,5-trisphosphate receptor-interacting protein [Carcharodon carcharias]XP_041066220.1 inositol 1,4,5-trisphosphate receptor-interacting protein [Carcharodon carcharias]XP_041066221.1 inositol 1,4,5-trisphosphate receptor-interacting protein [Carcharodon carcharias]XP_041066222.1 inositol 1,4,5-trisphosphate receptor-interacting protein [Carcharodon carcharias]XP_041066223.1 inositol 1
MAVGVVAMCLLMAATVIDRPFTFRQASWSVEQDLEQERLSRMKEREEQLQAEMQRLEKELVESVPGGLGSGSGGEMEEEHSWNLWSALSVIAFLLLEIWRQDADPRSLQELSDEDEDSDAIGDLSRSVALPDHQTLVHFYDKCIRVPGNELSRIKELVEGCADDLLEALRSVCNRDLDMEVEECIGIGSLYENWRVKKPLVCDLIVPFTPPEPYCFRADVLCLGTGLGVCSGGKVTGELSFGRIRVISPGEDASACLCGRTHLGEDMLCLVHGEQIMQSKPDSSGQKDELLWSATAPYLAKGQVIQWFQKALTKAWAKISHKYDFDLSFQDLERPGALRIRFRSGKTVHFNIAPVVEFENSDVYFMPLLASDTQPGTVQSNNISWPFTFAVYEKRFLKLMAKKLPESSCHLMCLQMVSFLHEKQCNLTGASGLTHYHLKTALLHLLSSQPLGTWHHSCLQNRLRDLLRFLEKALLEKRLNHFIVGNASTLPSFNIPDIFRSAEPLNLFRGFVTRRALYQRARRTMAEMLRNAAVLIREYSLESPSQDGIRARHKAAATEPS